MSKRKEKQASKPAESMGSMWMVVGLFTGWLVGAVSEVVCGVSMIRMLAGGVVGLALGALVDFIIDRRRKREAAVKGMHKHREKTT